MNRYHFVGIKGTGMSPLAQILFDMNNEVRGSDVEKSFFTEEALNRKGIEILPFDPENISEDQIVVQGNAFSDDHPEIVRARELGLTIYKY